MTETTDPDFHERYEKNVPPKVRQAVFDRDLWQCQSCGRNSNLEQHHIVYRSRGGRHVQNNLVTLCAKCHRLIHAQRLGIHVVERADRSVIFYFARYLHRRPR